MESDQYERSTDVNRVSDGRYEDDFAKYGMTMPNGESVSNGESVPNGESVSNGESVPNCESVSNGESVSNVESVTNGDLNISSAAYTNRNGKLDVTSSERTGPRGDAGDAGDLSCELPVPDDGGWGWMVAFASFMHNFLLDGVIYTFGIFFDDFLQHFGDSKGKTQTLSSVIGGSYLLIGPLVGVIESRFQCRRVAIVGAMVASLGLFLSTFSPNLDIMILLYGIVGGTGFGLVYGPSILIVSYYFNRRRALATGIAVCGSGIGGFVFAPLGALLLEVYGWKGAMWIISAIVLNGVVFAALYRPIQSEKKKLLDQTKIPGNKSPCSSLRQTLGISMLASPSVIVYIVSCFLVSTGFYIPFNFLPAFAKEIGLSASEGALLISIIGIFNTLLRVVIGIVSDRSWADCILTNGVVLVVGGITTFFIPYYTSFGVLAGYSAIFGSTIGIFVPLKSIILIELKGISKLTTGFGLLSLCIGVAVVIGSPIAGYLSDMTGDFSVVFYLSGTTITLGGVLCLPLRKILKWEQQKRDLQTHDSTLTVDTYM
ncbi:monocarboxylate transporter 12-like [Pecten maximus]|uniref:monocarboxylate transporter 12-like n=1 Tax=Pecten maximus TaxID=6579 RepID=UPI00145832DF|nr:monocarboxylate transporter 12-like [Pecten maximus]